MKIVRDTEDQLIVSNTPWLLALGVVLLLLVFMGAGLIRLGEDLLQGILIIAISSAGGALLLTIFVRRTQLILDRSSGDVILRRRGFLGYSEKRFALSDLSKAVVQESWAKKGQRTQRVALDFTSGPDKGLQPVTIVYISGRGPERAAAAINAWLDRQQSPLS